MKMNRKCLILLPLAGMILFLIAGCAKEDEVQNAERKYGNTLVYEDVALREDVSPYFFDNHFYKIELLGNNAERSGLVRQAVSGGLEEEFLMIEHSQKFYFNHTGLRMYSIPTADPEQTVIVYEHAGLFHVCLAEYSPAEEGRMQFRLLTMDGQLYYSLQLDSEMRMGMLKVYENEQINTFSSAVCSLTADKQAGEKSTGSEGAICCRKESSWSACMDCTVSDCADSWICKVAGMIAPVELVAGFAVSCIGAGADSRC